MSSALDDVLEGLQCHTQLLVGGNNRNGNGGVGFGNHACFAANIGSLVQTNTHVAQAGTNHLADSVGVFADAAGKDQLVQTAQFDVEGADKTDNIESNNPPPWDTRGRIVFLSLT